MKKIMTLLIWLLVATLSFSQNETANLTMNYDQTYFYFDGASTDVLATGDSLWTYTIWKPTRDKIHCIVDVKLDKTGGSGRVDIFLKGKTFPDRVFSNIDTFYYYGTADTTFTVNTSAVKEYDYWQLYIKGRTDNWFGKIEYLNVKFIK